jgi:hypothetical protein
MLATMVGFLVSSIGYGCVMKTNPSTVDVDVEQSITEDPIVIDQYEDNMIQETWEGMISVNSYLHADEDFEPITQLIVTNEDEFAAFVKRIPKLRVQMKNPAPPSDDPFVNGLKIDFSQSLLLVSIRADNMYAKAPIVAVFETNGTINAVVDVLPLGDTNMMSSAGGIGTYYAVQIPMVSQEIVFESK